MINQDSTISDDESDLNVVRVRNLCKTYRSRTRTVPALRDVSFSVRRGEVFGIIGPNGSGKTTTFRCLLGLATPTSGTAEVIGSTLAQDGSVGRVGAVIESPKVFPGFSGRQWLDLVRRTGGLAAARVDEVLAYVDLLDAADNLAGGFSLGMKQRLAIAAALLSDPAVLLLDEPTNGLDPEGMEWLRQMIRQEKAAGRTVLISSHLLGEIEAVCDRVAVFGVGEVLAVLDLQEIRADSEHRTVIVRTGNDEDAAAILVSLGIAPKITERGLEIDDERSAKVGRLLHRAGIPVFELYEDKLDLEKVFLRVLREQNKRVEG